MSETVGVVLATFNGERFIAEQLRSILEQSRQVDELIISDDSSADGTVQIVREFASRYEEMFPRGIQIIGNSGTHGVAANFERGLAASTTSYVAFSDQDDRWLPHKLERAMRALETGGNLLFASDARLTDATGSALGRTVFDAFASRLISRSQMVDDPLGVLLRQNYLPGMTMVGDAAFLKKCPVPSGWIHDYWFALNAAARGKLFVETEPLVDYRQHGTNLLGIRRQLSVPRILEVAARRMGTPQSSRGIADWTATEVWALAEHDPRIGEKLAFEERRRAARNKLRVAKLCGLVRLMPDYRRFSHLGGLGVLRDSFI